MLLFPLRNATEWISSEWKPGVFFIRFLCAYQDSGIVTLQDNLACIWAFNRHRQYAQVLHFTTSSLAWLNSFAGWLQTHCPAIALIFSFSESHTLAEHIYYVLLHCPMETYLLTPNTALFTIPFKTSLFYKLHPASFHVSISSASIHSPSIFEHLLYTRQKYIILDHRDEVAFSALKERPVQRDRWMLDRVLWQLQWTEEYT